MNIGNIPKLPEMPIFSMPDNLAPPTFDIAPPTLPGQGATAKANVDFDKSSDYYHKPAFTSLPDYSNEAEVYAKFAPIRHANRKADVSIFKQPESSFFIIRSNNIDDIHKVG